MTYINDYSFRYIFIDDGSTDDTLARIKKLREKTDLRYISFSRNFGKEAAMYAGLRASRGDFAVIMDVDLQHPPILIAEMIHKMEETGCDSCAARRVTRKGEPRNPQFLCKSILQDNEQIQRYRDNRRSRRLQADEQKDGESHRQYAGDTALFKRNIRMGGIRDRMDRVRKCEARVRGKQVVAVEPDKIRSRRIHRLRRIAAQIRGRVRRDHDRGFRYIPDDRDREDSDNGQGYPGICIDDMPHPVFRRSDHSSAQRYGRIYRQDVYGNEEKTCIYRKGKQYR